MIKPGEIQEYKINKEFTDREKARSLFWEWYEKANKSRDDFFVLSFYGIGGIGKSSLINQLCRELTVRSGLYIKYDFEYSGGFDTYSILTGIKQSIRNKYGDVFRFPLFNAALVLLAKKSDITFENDELVKSAVAESPHLQNVVNALSLVPVVGGYIQNILTFTSQICADIDNLSANAELKKKYKNCILEMGNLEADELRAKLPQYFANDMANNMRGLLKPLIIFIDTYEKYADTSRSVPGMVSDNWLWESTGSLIQRIPGVLWVIAGRDKLNWNENGEWDEEHLKCEDIEAFCPADSGEYLNKAGITDDNLVSHIVKNTGGVPVYLDLCVDTYYLLKSKGIEPGIKNFDVDRRKLAGRYAKYLDSVNRSLVYMLAAMGVWRDSEAVWVGNHMPAMLFSAELYNAMMKHSFIMADGDKKRMHNVMVEALSSEMDDSTVNAVNGALFHYRVSRLKEAKKSFMEYLPAVVDAVNAFCKITKADQYSKQYEDFRKLTASFTEIRRRGFVNDILNTATMLNEHCARYYSETDYYCESLKAKGDALFSAGKYESSLSCELLSYEMRRKTLGEDHPDTLNSWYGVSVDYSCLGQYEKALKLSQRVYEAQKKVLGEEHPDTLRSLHGIKVGYDNLGKYKEALKIGQQVYETRKRILGEEHPDTLSSLNAVGVIYTRLEKFEEALEIDRRVYEARKRILGEAHPDTINSLRNIKIDYICLGQHKEVDKITQQIDELLKRQQGK